MHLPHLPSQKLKNTAWVGAVLRIHERESAHVWMSTKLSHGDEHKIDAMNEYARHGWLLFYGFRNCLFLPCCLQNSHDPMTKKISSSLAPYPRDRKWGYQWLAQKTKSTSLPLVLHLMSLLFYQTVVTWDPNPKQIKNCFPPPVALILPRKWMSTLL